MCALASVGPSWTDDVVVEERKLQQYLHQKKHTIVLKGAAEQMKHTLTHIPTSNCGDGFVHLGDSLMLRSDLTGGLLQADIATQFEVGGSAARTGTLGVPLSTGQMLTSCPRNVFTLSRVSDDDGYGEDPFLHYGQPVRIGTCQQLSDRQHYLFASDEGADDQALEKDEKLHCLYPRAGPATFWRLVRVGGADAPQRLGDDLGRVKLGDSFRLESVHMRSCLGSDDTLRKTHYGNEFRVFGAPVPEPPPAPPPQAAVPSRSPRTGPRGTLQGRLSVTPRLGPPSKDAARAAEPEPEGPPTTVWSFVDTSWCEHVVAAVQLAAGGDVMVDELGSCLGEHVQEKDYRKYLDGLTCPAGGGSDGKIRNAGQMLKDPTVRAEHDLHVLESEDGARAREVLGRIFPLIRNQGMHVTRKLRRMCADADVNGEGSLPLRSFAGVLSWVAVRLRENELMELHELLAPEARPDGDLLVKEVDYRRFFALMAPPLQEMRWNVVRDAYAKLRSQAAGGFVEVSDIQRHWNPRCHPGVQQGVMLESEAREEFLRQWDITSADALITWEEFFDYYQDVSLAVENIDIFIEIVRRAWGL